MAQLSLFKGKRQRGTKPRKAKEFGLHVMTADLMRRWGTRGWIWSHFPSGEKRNPITGGRLKRMGLQKGWPDFLLVSPRPARLYMLELKRLDGGLTDEQASLQAWCLANDVPYAVCDNFRDLVAQLRDWGAVRATVSA